MVITESIQKAIQAAIRKSGSSLSFSRSIGISHTTVSFWLNGRTRKINATVWQNLLPLIQEYLDPAETVSYPSHPVAAIPHGGALREGNAVWYGAGGGAVTLAPLLHLADLDDFDPQIDSMDELIRLKSACSVQFTSAVKPSYFAVEVDKKHSGFFTEGTRLLLRWQEAPYDGDTVLVKLRNKKGFLFASYTRKDDEVGLIPLQKGDRKRRILKTGFHNVSSWIVPIREAVLLF